MLTHCCEHMAVSRQICKMSCVEVESSRNNSSDVVVEMLYYGSPIFILSMLTHRSIQVSEYCLVSDATRLSTSYLLVYLHLNTIQSIFLSCFHL